MQPKQPRDFLSVLEQGRWFSALPEALKDRLLDHAQLRPVPANTRLFSRGDPNAGLYCVLAGAVEIGAVDLGGREMLLAVAEPPQWFGEIATFDDGPRTHDAWTRTATTLLLVPLASLQVMLHDDPVLWRHLGSLVVEKMRALFESTEGSSTLPSPVRLARRLQAMTDAHGMVVPGHARHALTVNQRQLGAMLGLTRQTVSEVLRTFEEQGVLKRRYGALEILDPDALRRIAAGG